MPLAQDDATPPPVLLTSWRSSHYSTHNRRSCYGATTMTSILPKEVKVVGRSQHALWKATGSPKHQAVGSALHRHGSRDNPWHSAIASQIRVQRLRSVFCIDLCVTTSLPRTPLMKVVPTFAWAFLEMYVRIRFLWSKLTTMSSRSLEGR